MVPQDLLITQSADFPFKSKDVQPERRALAPRNAGILHGFGSENSCFSKVKEDAGRSLLRLYW